MNYRLLTGCFSGSIIEEGSVLDVDFNELDSDLQSRIVDWATAQLGRKYLELELDNRQFLGDGFSTFAYKHSPSNSIKWNEIKEDYEASWDSEEIDADQNLKPLSEWH